MGDLLGKALPSHAHDVGRCEGHIDLGVLTMVLTRTVQTTDHPPSAVHLCLVRLRHHWMPSVTVRCVG